MGRPFKADGRERFGLYPQRGAGRFIYALGFADGRTKIGTAHNPRLRLVQHWVKSNGAVSWSHVFGCIGGRIQSHSTEKSALRKAASISRRIGSTECFVGLPRDAALRCVRDAIREHA